MATKWTLDQTHSEVQFKVKHLMITSVTGYFRKFSAFAEAGDDHFNNTKVRFEAESASVDTNNEARDNHLRSGEFFDSSAYPLIVFESTEFRRIGDEDEYEYQLDGNLTIRDVTRPVTLNVEFAGIQRDPYGNVKAGFTVEGILNRKDWNLNWNTAIEGGGWLVSDDVRVEASVQFVKEAKA